ncbi:MAG: hypothetical protein GF329_12095 [Candidatus Lokiarchaeota archaeon]|nr:hypothetical protein [Candidatus Lokiarchaeota archaeon]
MIDWKEPKGILEEMISWMRKHSPINKDIYITKGKKIKNLLDRLSIITDYDIEYKKKNFAFDRFLKLDAAQKAFVILATMDEKLKNELENHPITNREQKLKSNFKLIVNTIYLRQLKTFSNIRKQILSEESNEKNTHIKKYLRYHPKIKKLGCGKFSLNFHRHVKNLIEYLENK